MGFVVGLLVFILTLAFSAPFFVALVLGAVAWIVTSFLRKASAGTDAATGATVAEQADAVRDPLTSEFPNTGDPIAIRAYFTRLSARIRTLEDQVAALGGKPRATPAPEAPRPAPAPEAPPVTQAAPPAAAPAVVAAPPAAPAPQPIVLGYERKHAAERAAQPSAEQGAQVPPPAHVPPRAPEPAEPEGPSFFERLISGNLVAKAGALILFIGVGFLLKFAYDRGMVPPEARLAGVALAAAALSLIGWRLLETRWLYAVILQGAASGLLYLDVFFALKTFGFIGVPLAFGLFALIGVATTLLAVRLEAKPLALLGLTGAFMAPILASTGEGRITLLFSYYLLLNFFILGVSWWRAWRELNLTGWVFTFGVAVMWGAQYYRPELFPIVEPFLLAFFAIYLVIPILFATRQPPELRGLVDGTLVFGTPAVVAMLQGRLVWDLPYGLAWSCAIGALLYAVLAASVWRHQHMRLLGQTYIALAVGLGTLAIFYAFGAYTTFALWTIEGAALLWVSLRQNNALGRAFALLVQAAGAVQFFLRYDEYSRFNPYYNDAVLGCAIIAVAGFISAAMLRRYRDAVSEAEGALAPLALVWGAAAFALGGLDVIHHAAADAPSKAAFAILWFCAGGAVAELWGSRVAWPAVRGLTAVQPVVLAVAAPYLLAANTHPLAGPGWIAWPLGLGTLFWHLHRQRRDAVGFALEARYASGWVILVALATWEAAWWIDKRRYAYAMLIGALGHAAAALRFRLRESGTAPFPLSALVLLWGMAFWFLPGLLWIHEGAPEFEVRAALLLVSLTALVYWLLSSPLQWPGLRLAAQLPWIAIPAAVILAQGAERGAHPFGGGLWALAWIVPLALAAWTLWREELQGRAFATAWRHMVLLYAPLALVTWELGWWLVEKTFGGAWRMAGYALPAGAALLAITQARESGRWPLAQHWLLYRDGVLLPAVLGLAVWTLAANLGNPGTLAPFRTYLPLANPLDLAVILAGVALLAWARSKETDEARRALWVAGGALGFVWINAIALRTIHYWADVPYRIDRLMASVLVQSTLSLLWSSTALALMLYATRRAARGLWVTGAVLLAVVVGKLFLVDLANTGTVARIVSFVGVGVLLLAIGYAAPVPPGQKEDSKQ